MILDMLAQSSAVNPSTSSQTKFFRSLSPAARAALEAAGMVFSGTATEPSTGRPAHDDLPGQDALGSVAVPETRMVEDQAAHQVVVRSTPAWGVKLLGLPDLEQRVYQTLRDLAQDHARVNARKLTTVYVIHTSAELLQDALEVGHTRFYEALKRLKAAGLIAHKGFVERVEGRPVKSGTLFAILTDPERCDIVPRFRFWDWQHQYRNMASAIKTGKTVYAYRTRGDTEIPEGSKVRFQILKTFTLFGHLDSNPVNVSVSPGVSDREFLYNLGDLVEVHWTARATWIDQAARKLATLFGDTSLNLYRWILWASLKAFQQGRDVIQQVITALLNVLGDMDDEIPTNYGAVIVKKLKTSGIWDCLKNT